MSIASEITRLQNAKASIKTSIENKGVTVGNGTLDTYASKIDAIETGITPTGTINITENGTYDVTDKASANVNVNSGDISEYFRDSMQYNGSVPALLSLIKTIPMVTITGTSCENMFQNSGITHLPLLDTSNITNMTNMLTNTKITEIPAFDTSNVTKFGYFCHHSDNSYTLTKVPLLNLSKAIEINYMITGNKGLTDLGGFQNLGQAFDTTKAENYVYYKLDLSKSTRLTHDSLMNVINNLYDIAAKGCNTQQVVMGSTNLAKLTAEEVAIGTSKGWSIS